MSTLTKNSTNAELIKAMPQITNGNTVIFSIEDSKSGNSKVAYLAQQVTGESNNIATSLFLGWNSRIVRMQQRIAPELLSKFKVGQIIPADIFIQEITKPAYDGQAAKVNPSTGEAILSEGKAVYEHGSLVPKGQGKVVKLPREATVVADPASLIGA